MRRPVPRNKPIVTPGSNPYVALRHAILAVEKDTACSTIFAVYKRKSGKSSNDGTRKAYDDAQEKLADNLVEIGIPRERIQVFADMAVSGTKAMEDRPGLTALTQRIRKGEVALVTGIDAARFFRDTEGENVWPFMELCASRDVPVITHCTSNIPGMVWMDMQDIHTKGTFALACATAGREGQAIIERGIAAKLLLVGKNKFVGGKLRPGFYADYHDEKTVRPYKPHIPIIKQIQRIAIEFAVNNKEIASFATLARELKRRRIMFPPFTKEGLGTTSQMAVEYAYQCSVAFSIITNYEEDGVPGFGRVPIGASYYMTREMLKTFFSNEMMLGVRLFGSGRSVRAEVARREEEAARLNRPSNHLLNDVRYKIDIFPELSIYEPGEEELFFEAADHWSKIDMRQWANFGFEYDEEEDLTPEERAAGVTLDNMPWEQQKYRDNINCPTKEGRPLTVALDHGKYGGLAFCMWHGMDARSDFAGRPNQRYLFTFVPHREKPAYMCLRDNRKDIDNPICSRWGNFNNLQNILDIETNEMLRGITEREDIKLYAAEVERWKQDTERHAELLIELPAKLREIDSYTPEVDAARLDQTTANENLAAAISGSLPPTREEKRKLQDKLLAATTVLRDHTNIQRQAEAEYAEKGNELSGINARLAGITPEEMEAEARATIAQVLKEGDTAHITHQQKAMRLIVDWVGALTATADHPCSESLLGVRWKSTSEMTWYVGWRIWKVDPRPYTEEETRHIQATWPWGQWEDIRDGLLPNRRYSDVRKYSQSIPITSRQTGPARMERKRRGTNFYHDRMDKNGSPMLYDLAVDGREKSNPYDQKHPGNPDLGIPGVSHLRLFGHPSIATRCHVIGKDGSILTMDDPSLATDDPSLPEYHTILIPEEVRIGLDILLDGYEFNY
ncbi:MAG: hypothetical protein JWL77_4110 [Chthonomonadaceae bacterium]|nr:hypothetical protein [Chthonomonadaceae bacterium]